MSQQEHSDQSPHASRLFENGQVILPQGHDPACEITRGMTILTREGYEVGRVAAVVLDAADRHVSHFLLSRAGSVPDYRLVSIDLVEYMSQQVILLKINRETIASLPNRAREDFQ